MKISLLLIVTLFVSGVLTLRLSSHKHQKSISHGDDSSDEKRGNKNVQKLAAPHVEQSTVEAVEEATVSTTSPAASTVAIPATVSIPSTTNSTQATQKQLVTNPLAQNIIIENRQQLSLDQKQRLDNPNINYEACPVDKPFFNGQTCIACKDYFNLNTKNCTTCQGNTAYDQDSYKCLKITWITNLEAENLLLKYLKLSVWYNFQQRVINTSPISIQRCSIEKPFAINGECTVCSASAPLFNINTELCEACPEDTQYNKHTKSCVSEAKTIVAPVSSASAETSTVESSSTNAVQPTTVVAVPVATVASNVHASKHATNPETYGLILNEPLNDYIAKVNALKEQGYELCESAKPYYDGKQCVACAGEDSKFDLATYKCTRCPKGTYYLYASRACVTG